MVLHPIPSWSSKSSTCFGMGFLLLDTSSLSHVSFESGLGKAARQLVRGPSCGYEIQVWVDTAARISKPTIFSINTLLLTGPRRLMQVGFISAVERIQTVLNSRLIATIQWRNKRNHALFMWFREGGVWIDSKYSQEDHRSWKPSNRRLPSHPLLTQPDSRLYGLTSTTGSLLPKLGRNGFTKGENKLSCGTSPSRSCGSASLH